ncbi:hypothetical protein ADK77_10290 [Streptomyces antibioticus]|nr:hypothetical protein [Streptomyces antibioticus]KOG72737.1 hypothetical protein ADK77_10290 [Streptomyces antibioticus]
MLDCLWTTLASDTSVGATQLHGTLWDTVDGWSTRGYLSPDKTPEQGEFIETVTLVLDDLAGLWLLARSPDGARVELTDLGRQVAGERAAQTARLDGPQ